MLLLADVAKPISLKNQKVNNVPKPIVLFFIDTLQTGGAEISLLQILKNFKTFHPIVVRLYPKNDDLKEQFIFSGIKVIDLNLPTNFFSLWKVRPYIKQLSDLQPSLIHSTLFRSDMLARNVGRSLAIPVINSLVNNTYSMRRYRMEPWSRKIKLLFCHLIDLLTAHRVHAFISNSSTIKTSISKALFLSSDKVQVIYRGRTIDKIDEAWKTVRKDLSGSVNDEIQFLNVSRLLARKGQVTLIKAFSQFLKTYPNARLTIAGEGPERNSLEALTQELKIADRVHFLGTVLDTDSLYRNAHFLIFPSHYEGLPGVLIEAMLAGLPIIASDIPENRECVTEEMAIFHKVGDSADLTRSMLKAIQQSDWAERTSKAHHHATEVFDVDKIAALYESFYENTINTFSRQRNK